MRFLDIVLVSCHDTKMIRSFKDRLTERVAANESPKGFPADLVRTAARKMFMLHNATRLEDLSLPRGNGLHALSKERKGQHAIKINDQFRICFRWDNGDAHEVEIVDYH